MVLLQLWADWRRHRSIRDQRSAGNTWPKPEIDQLLQTRRRLGDFGPFLFNSSGPFFPLARLKRRVWERWRKRRVEDLEEQVWVEEPEMFPAGDVVLPSK